jgi:hypothetical protein
MAHTLPLSAAPRRAAGWGSFTMPPPQRRRRLDAGGGGLAAHAARTGMKTKPLPHLTHFDSALIVHTAVFSA